MNGRPPAEPQSADMETKLRPMRCLVIAISVAVPLFISPISFDSYLLPKRVLFQILTLALAGLWIGSSFRVGVSRRDPLWVPRGLFLGWCLVSIVFGFHSLRQLRDFGGLLLAVVFWAISRNLWHNPRDRLNLVAWLHLPAFLIALYAVFQDFGIDIVHPTGGVNDWRARIVSTMGNPNFVAGYLAILFPALVARACHPRSSRKWFWAVGVPVVSLCVAVFVVTFCVGAFIALVLALITCFFFPSVLRRFYELRKGRVAVLGAIGCAILAFYCTDNPYNGREGSVLDQAQASPQWRTGFAARQFNWRTTRLMIEEHPITGIGFANFQASSMTYQGRNYARQDREHGSAIVKLVDQPHHQLLETAAETGIPGVFFLLWLFVAIIRAALRAIRSRNTEDSCLLAAAFLGFLTAAYHSLSSFPFHLPASTLATLVWLSILLPGRDEEPEVVHQRSFRPAYLIVLLAVLAIPFLLVYISNVYLRKGYEAGEYGVYDLQTAVALDPLDYMNYHMLGRAYHARGDLERAANAYLNALRLQDDFATHLALRDVFAELGAMEILIEQQKELIRLNPGYIPYREQLMKMYEARGMEEKAEDVRRSIEALSGSE